MNSSKIEIRKSPLGGKGVFAKQAIKKNLPVAAIDGRVYSWRSNLWNNHLYNHCVQFEEKKWRYSPVASMFNHSCKPNCGIKGLFTIVAMRNIKAGEELTWDYEMTEDHPYWRLKCKCGNKECRKVIGAFKNMPEKIRKKYKGYISSWLVKKYNLST